MRIGFPVVLAAISFACGTLACAPGTGRPRPTAASAPRDEGATGGPRIEGIWRARLWSDAVERCGGKCRFRTRAYSNVRLELKPNGVARARDEGEQIERFRAASGERSNHTEWTRTWTGSWSEGGAKLQIQLANPNAKCTRTTDDGKVEDPCEPVSLTLQCERERIRLEKSRPSTEMAWVCDANQPETTGLTPMPWVFGDERLLVAADIGTLDDQRRQYLAARPKKKRKSE